MIEVCKGYINLAEDNSVLMGVKASPNRCCLSANFTTTSTLFTGSDVKAQYQYHETVENDHCPGWPKGKTRTLEQASIKVMLGDDDNMCRLTLISLDGVCNMITFCDKPTISEKYLTKIKNMYAKYGFDNPTTAEGKNCDDELKGYVYECIELTSYTRKGLSFNN